MKSMTSWIMPVCVLILGAAIGYWIATKRPRVIPMVFSNVGSLYTYAEPGDVIKWTNDVHFKYAANPCVGEPDPTSQCTIQAQRGSYFYDCVEPVLGCTDPGVRVGSAINMQVTRTSLPGPFAIPKDPKIWCESGTAKGQAINATADHSFEFDPVGDIKFTVAVPGICTQRDSLTEQYPDCTIKPGATFPPNYHIHILLPSGASCDGTGGL